MSAVATVPVPPIAPRPPAAPLSRLYHLSVVQYHQMADAGILTPEDRVELLRGLLVAQMTKHPPHTLATQLTRETIERLLPRGWFVNVQEPITTTTSEPEPDVSVVRGTRRSYGNHHPNPADLGLVIEVSDSSLADDRGFKKGIYAEAGIAVYWIINLVDNQVEVYTNPSGATASPDYMNRQDFGPADEVALVIDGKEVARIPVSEVLP